MEQNKKEENKLDNLKFKQKKIQFAPDDVEKMESMTREERMDYMKYLKENGLYITIEE